MQINVVLMLIGNRQDDHVSSSMIGFCVTMMTGAQWERGSRTKGEHQCTAAEDRFEFEREWALVQMVK